MRRGPAPSDGCRDVWLRLGTLVLLATACVVVLAIRVPLRYHWLLWRARHTGDQAHFDRLVLQIAEWGKSHREFLFGRVVSPSCSEEEVSIVTDALMKAAVEDEEVVVWLLKSLDVPAGHQVRLGGVVLALERNPAQYEPAMRRALRVCAQGIRANIESNREEQNKAEYSSELLLVLLRYFHRNLYGREYKIPRSYKRRLEEVLMLAADQ